MLRFSSHAMRRMVERSVARVEVERTLDDPLEVVPTRYGRSAACKETRDGKYVVAIFEADGEDLIVITVLKVTAEGARRFGFTRV